MASLSTDGTFVTVGCHWLQYPSGHSLGCSAGILGKSTRTPLNSADGLEWRRGKRLRSLRMSFAGVIPSAAKQTYQAWEQAVPLADSAGRHVGRIGALAVALGIGAAVASMPLVAHADSRGSAGSSGTADGGSSSRAASENGAALPTRGTGPEVGAAQQSPMAGRWLIRHCRRESPQPTPRTRRRPRAIRGCLVP